MKINGIILAAGLSHRMNAFKPLLLLKGKTMIEHCVDSMLQAGVDQIVVVLGYRSEEIEALLQDRYDVAPLHFACNHKFAATDMLASVKTGVSAMAACDAFYLLPGDMPAIHAETFLNLRDTMSRTGARVVFPIMEGQRRHPPLISWQCKDDILKFDGTNGLQELWEKYDSQIAEAEVSDPGCMLDADTPADLIQLAEYMQSQAIGGALWKR